jgi:hypothetical protein
MTTNHSLPIWIEVANRYMHRYTSQGIMHYVAHKGGTNFGSVGEEFSHSNTIHSKGICDIGLLLAE